VISPAALSPRMHLRPVSRRVEYELVPEERPQRGLACVNVGREDKEVFDLLQWWWSMREGRALSQWEVASRLLALGLSHPAADLPPAEAFKGPGAGAGPR
jgi:hypothetical protein